VTTPTYRGVVLAAGGSRRFAGPVAKQLVEIDGEPAVRRAARRALESRLEVVVVVTGHEAETVRGALDGLAVEVVHNPSWQAGQSTSVRTGLAAVAAGAAAVVFIPCDQPFLTAGLLDGLIARHVAGGAAIVVPAWRGRRGAPALIDSSLFAEVATVTGDAGARQLFARHPVAEMEVDDPAQLSDFDSESELRDLLAPELRLGR
jgi:molybdenum cofactor cytidylyltransferase